MSIVSKTIEVTVKFISQGLDKINKQIDGLNEKTNEFTKSTNETSKAQRDLNKETEKLNKNLKSTQTSTTKASKAKRTFASSVGRAISIVAQFTVAMYAVQAAMKIVSFFTIDAAKAAIDFQAALGSLQAIANVSSADLEKLRSVIFEVAGTTRFSAIEIAELQKELSRLGFTTEEVISSTEAIARFAEAIGEDLGSAAQFVGKQLQAFGLNASSAFEITNAFTALINNSALSMETLATSMQYASSIASGLGVSIEETGALLGVLTNNGITASRAGTGLRQIFLELGAEGGSLTGILDSLAQQNLSLSDAEELVGKRAAGALTVLVRQRKEVSSLLDAQRSLNAATIASARQNATFAGQLKLVNAQIDSILINIGNWITKSNVLLNVIEKLGGGLEARGFSIVSRLGLTTEETQAFVDNVMEIQALLKGKNTIFGAEAETVNPSQLKNILGIDFDRAAELSVILEDIVSTGQDWTRNKAAFIQVFGNMKAQQKLIYDVNIAARQATDDYAEAVENLLDKNKKGIKVEEDRDKLYSQIEERQVSISKEMTERLNMLSTLGQDPTKDKAYMILEKESERLNRLSSILANMSDTDEATLESFQKLFDMQNKLTEARDVGDIPLAKKLEEEYKAQLKILKASGLEKDYMDFVKNMLVSSIEFGTEQTDEQLAKAIENQMKMAASYLQDMVNSGDISLEQAGVSFFNTLTQAVANIEDPVLRAELEAKIASGFEIDPKKIEEQSDDAIKNLVTQYAEKIAQAGTDAIFEATNRRLEAEQAAVDARYSYEEDRLQSLLQSNLITQAEYERKREQLERERIKKTNEIEKKQFEADKLRAIVDIAIDTARAVAQFGLITPQAAIALAAGAIQTGIVASQKFVPVKFEEGGLVNGKSHAQGGVPFKVQGVGGYEMEGGEYIVNKKATAKYLPVLEQLNSYGRVNNSMFKHFAQGGMVGDTLGIGESSRINALLLKRLNQPIRAYVSESELMTKTNERINQKRKSAL